MDKLFLTQRKIYILKNTVKYLMAIDFSQKDERVADPMAVILGSRYLIWYESKHPRSPSGIVFDQTTIKGFLKTLPKQEVDGIVAKANISKDPKARVVLQAAKGL